MSLPVQHLSDEAIAAYADGVLGPGARDRAARHVATCAECAHDVRRQDEARAALRAATAPTAPMALLQRLRDLPMTAPLSGPPNLRTVVIGDGGAPMFAAYGTVVGEPQGPAPAEQAGQPQIPEMPMVGEPAPQRHPMSLDRGRARLRMGGRSLALAGATTVLAVGLVGGGIGSAAARGTSGPVPAPTPRPGFQTGDVTAPAAVTGATARTAQPQLRVDSSSRLGTR